MLLIKMRISIIRIKIIINRFKKKGPDRDFYIY